ncbi:Histone H2A.Z-specific chaperone chz1 [Penicillium diatomitis]|uniref:Histone H2A.Z-specific chaperone chz1 n=1 Tax=Penicillium diatomitis TaxID=2819901 RepID=A0A9W9WUL0_9EURO|nr:Histone H2A.Z-specific chaperone chz1 [Penicillium diatomitis]KAJ5476983.1 Histone H2A.Z-specific chaperone chz1 [Penicillium diatomitis]
MGDHATTNNPSSSTTEAALADKGKGKAQDPDMSMEDDSDSESDNGEEMEEANDDLEPISETNIINGGRRTRGKKIDWEEVRKTSDDMDDEEDDDEDYQGGADEDQMRD